MQATVTIKSCSGCRGEHERLEFRQLEQPVEGYTHTTVCPATGKELLFREVDEPEPAADGR